MEGQVHRRICGCDVLWQQGPYWPAMGGDLQLPGKTPIQASLEGADLQKPMGVRCSVSKLGSQVESVGLDLILVTDNVSWLGAGDDNGTYQLFYSQRSLPNVPSPSNTCSEDQ